MASEDQVQLNLDKQREEMEVLKSIYDSDFQVEDDTPTFSIMVHVGHNEGEEATLVVSYNLDYPSSAPPVFHLSVPWLGLVEKEKMCALLNEVYLENIGEPVVYFWIEKLKTALMEMKPEKMEPLQTAVIDLTELKSKGDEASWNEDNASNDYKSESAIGDSKTNRCGNVTKLPTIFTGEPLTDRKSTFQAHVAGIHSVEEVKLVLEQLYCNKKIATATHNMYAYRIFKEESSSSCIQDCEDDGETHAGGRLLHLLQILECKNVVVVVTRWFGGIQLHGDRFKHINNVARILLDKQGYISKTSPAKKSTGKSHGR